MDNIQRLGIDIVSRCQLKCVGCPNSIANGTGRFPPLAYVDPEIFSQILHNVDVKSIGYLKLYNFGEIMLHPHLFDVLLKIKQQRWKAKHVEISTNGQIVNRDLERVIASNIITRFGVSADGDCTSETYELVRNPARWPRLIRFLKKVQKFRRKYKVNTAFFLKVICTDDKARRAWLRLAKEYNMAVVFRKWILMAGAEQNLFNKPLVVRNHVCKRVKSSRIRVFAQYDGTVVPCCNHPQASVYGNLQKQKLSTIWKSRERRNFLQTLSKARSTHPICGRCDCK